MKNVKYKDSDWQTLSEGIIQLTSSGLFQWITEADSISEDAKSSCDTYDVDCAIDIDTASNVNYDELENRFTLLQQAIQHVPDTLSADVDYPFYNEMDSVLEKLSNMNVMGYTTMARGYFPTGTSTSGIPTSKMNVTLGDILGNSSPLTDYLRVEYNEKKELLENVSYEDYQKMSFADTSFDYYSRGEKIKGLGVTLVVNGAVIAVGAMLPWQIMVALGLVSAGKNGYDAYTGTDLLTGKELSNGDRILRGLSGIADLALAAYGTYKGVQAIKGTNRVIEVEKPKNVESKKASGATKAQKVETFTDRVNDVRSKMPNNTLKKRGNMATADVNVTGLPDEFMAHSQIDSLADKGADLGGFSMKKPESKRVFKNYEPSASTINGRKYDRFHDTEAKILEDIASKITDPNISGTIDLFTELPACQSCSNIILEFRRKFPNIQLNIFTKN